MTAGIFARGHASESYVGPSPRYPAEPVTGSGRATCRYKARRVLPAPPPVIAIAAGPIKAQRISIERPDRFVVCYASQFIYRDGEGVYFPRRPFTIAAALLAANGGAVSKLDLVDALYHEDPNGGPNQAYEAIAVWLARDVRPQLRKLGVAVHWPLIGHLWARDLRGS
jgi:hypothetical protein